VRDAESRFAKSIQRRAGFVLAAVLTSALVFAASAQGAGAPTIDAFFTSGVTATSAQLNALINPNGEATTYRFEYGKSTGYGNVTPDEIISAGITPEPVNAQITGLDGGVYHFRVVAEHKSTSEVVTTGDQTFTFYPPSCPNEHLRQQTGALYLPDCRAYELVSPANSGNALLKPLGPFSPTATNPSRFSFGGSLGVIPGVGPAQADIEDLYVATRHPDGWTTRYVGIPSDTAAMSGGPPTDGPGYPEDVYADSSMNKFLDWSAGTQSHSCCGELGSFAGYMWNAEGGSLGRLPSHIEEISEGTADWSKGGFYGDVRPSADFSHYFFSSANVAFTPGGLTSGSGSAYDDNLETGTIEKISTLPGGGDIPEEPGDETNDDFLRLPAASTDGSRVLIEAPKSGVCGLASCPPPPDICDTVPGQFLHGCPGPLPSHLYMHVHGLPTYDISGSHTVILRGETPDLSKVFFTSTEQLTADDHDTSSDLFMWTDSPTPTITRLSTGSSGSTGNVDTCSVTWVSQCGVEIIHPTCRCKPGNLTESIPARADNFVAAGTGEIYFYSPEQLESGKGTLNQRNLYVFRNGHAQYVTTLPGNTLVNRIQVSPDGSHMAFVTAGKITSYNNTSPTGICTPENTINGVPATGPLCQEMYSYEPGTGVIRCVSCIPNGDPPESDVEASLNGLFMTKDGRTFFSTEDALVPRDSNGLLDVYEFVDNRPQLISSGTAAADRNRTEYASLVGVSADGTDAYFSTLDTLVGQDQNGEFFKFYDARTNGGFPFLPPPAPCAAADECHGPGTNAPTEITIGTGEALGDGGNLHPVKHKKKHHGKRKHKKDHHHHHGNRG
jgi:hypothetical protein